MASGMLGVDAAFLPVSGLACGGLSDFTAEVVAVLVAGEVNTALPLLEAAPAPATGAGPSGPESGAPAHSPAPA